MRIKVAVHHGDALTYEADVLVIKHAQALYGLDEIVHYRLTTTTRERTGLQPAAGSFSVQESNGAVAAKWVLIVGTVDLRAFGYRELREFSQRTLAALADSIPQATSLVMTLHGANYGLDELEAFRAEVAGLIDGITTARVPSLLTSITFIESDLRRADRLSRALKTVVPDGYFEAELQSQLDELPPATQEQIRSAGYESDSRPLIFVAMPFADEMQDVYEFGIEGAVHEASFLCERADTSAFTGDVLERIKERIRVARFLIADLSGANPNVYLEVGFAWGCGTPTILLCHGDSPRKFDVQSHRCILYKRIGDLKKQLTRELRGLRQVNDLAPPSANSPAR